jgi:hypothetical protein
MQQHTLYSMPFLGDNTIKPRQIPICYQCNRKPPTIQPDCYSNGPGRGDQCINLQAYHACPSEGFQAYPQHLSQLIEQAMCDSFEVDELPESIVNSLRFAGICHRPWEPTAISLRIAEICHGLHIRPATVCGDRIMSHSVSDIP